MSATTPPSTTTVPHAAGPPPPPGPILRPGRPFTAPELTGMVLDGIVQRVVLDAHVPAGSAIDHATKARALAALLPGALVRRGCLGRLGAAWFHGCAPAPETLAVLVSKHARTTTTVPMGFSLHQTEFTAVDRVRHEQLWVTTPLRTAVDLAMHVPETAGSLALLRLMSASHVHCPAQLVYAAVRALGKAPGRRRAMARVRSLGRELEAARCAPPDQPPDQPPTQPPTGRWPEVR